MFMFTTAAGNEELGLLNRWPQQHPSTALHQLRSGLSVVLTKCGKLCEDGKGRQKSLQINDLLAMPNFQAMS